MLEIKNLSQTFNKGKSNEAKVLSNISYTFESTGLYTILGESGSGKTTLLNIISGNLYKDNAISYDNNYYNKKELDLYRAENISYIFQNYLILEDYSVYDNLRISLEIIGIKDEEEVEKRIDYVLKALRIEKYKYKLAKALSGGEQQRLSIARAIIKKPKILIADEPTGNLDTKNSIDVLEILSALSKDILVILVTHNKKLAYSYSDKIIFLKDGEITSELCPDKARLDNNDNLKVYNLDKQKITKDNLELTIYNDKANKINIDIVIKDNKAYIINNPHIFIIDEDKIDYEEKILTKEASYHFDNSLYIDKKEKDTSFFKLLLSKFKINKTYKFKCRLLYGCATILGVFLALVLLLFFNVFDNYYQTDINKNIIRGHDYQSVSTDVIVEAYDKGYIDNLVDLNAILNVKLNNSNFILDFDDNYNAAFFPISYVKDYVLGDAGDGNSIVISTDFADKLIKSTHINYKQLIGMKLNLSSGEKELEISGITNTSYTDCYISVEALHYIRDMNTDIYYNYIIKDNNTNYNIIEGRDISNINEILVDRSDNKKIGDVINNYTVVGIVDKIKDKPNLIVASSLDAIYYIQGNRTSYYLPNSLSSGFKFDSLKYAYAPRYEKVFMTNFKIKDYYDDFMHINKGSLVISDEAYFVIDRLIDGYGISNIGFDIIDYDGLNQILRQNSAYTITYRESLRERVIEDINNKLIIISILLFIIIIYGFFLLRTNLIFNNRNYMILRNIGANKKYIKKRFLVDSIYTTLRTSLFGYTLFTIIVYVINSNFFVSPLIDISFMLCGFIFLLGINFLIAIILISLYLRKQPYQLQVKYDI